MSNSYRPSYHDPGPPGFGLQGPHTIQPPGYQNLQPYHPLPPGPPPLYRFGASTAQGPSPYQYNNFAFAATNAIPQYPEHVNGHPHHSDPQNSRRKNTNRGGKNGNQAHRGRGPRAGPSDRPLLTFRRGDSPDQLFGMSEHHNAEQRFLDVDDMSDSAEEPMQESESGEDESNIPGNDGEVAGDVNEEQLSPRKRKLPAEEATVLPKWSNPETYTALPPPDESTRKRKDVVKMIRKARVTVEKDKDDTGQVATNDDFISFNLDNERREVEHSDMALASGDGVPGAPTGPRAFKRSKPSGQTPQNQDQDQVPQNDHKSLIPEPEGPSSVPGGSERIVEKLSQDRKRKRDVESPPPLDLYEPQRKRGKQPFSGGYVLKEWRTPEPENPVPWFTVSHQNTENNGFRLHKEICDFYEFVRPRAFEEAMRSDLLERLQKFVDKWGHKTCKVHCFGSFAAGLYLPNADMDVVVISDQFFKGGMPMACQTPKQMYSFGNQLQQAQMAQRGSVDVVSHAKVPIIKFVDKTTGLRVDMSFENMNGIVANGTFQQWKAQYPAMPILVTVMKQFLMMRGLNEVVNGGIGGFTVTCLVTSLLQNMPRLQMGEFRPEDNLGEILLEFLDFYGNLFDCSRVAIRMAPPALVNKLDLQARGLLKIPNQGQINQGLIRLAILDPNQERNDISGGSKRVDLIFEKFSRAREELFLAMRSPSRKSLLDWMLGGNYNTFLWHRERLRSLYVSKYGTGEDL